MTTCQNAEDHWGLTPRTPRANTPTTVHRTRDPHGGTRLRRHLIRRNRQRSWSWPNSGLQPLRRQRSAPSRLHSARNHQLRRQLTTFYPRHPQPSRPAPRLHPSPSPPQPRLPRDPGVELRSVLSRGAAQRLREHVIIIENTLRDIINSGIELGEFPEQDVDTTVTLVNSCLSGRLFPEEQPARDKVIAATELFVLRAVGARVPAPSGFPKRPPNWG